MTGRALSFTMTVAALGFLCVSAALTSPSVAQSAADASKFELAGVRLEMNIDQAKLAIAKYDPALQVELRKAPSTSGKWTDTYLSAIRPDPSFQHGYSEEITVAFTRGPDFKAYAIMHDIGFPKGQERKFKDVIQDLNAKYGPGVKSMGGFNDWVFEADGVVIDGAQDTKSLEQSERFTTCWHGLFEATTSLNKANFGHGAPNGLPKSFRKGCGVNVRAIVQTYDPAQPEDVQEIYQRIISDKLAVQDGRPTEDEEAIKLSQRRINPTAKPALQ